jgi:hypothetical protein
VNRSTEGSGRGFVRHFLFLLTLAILAFALTAAPASADPPTGTLDSISAVSYDSAHVTATVHPVGETYWRFDYSTDGVNWVEGPGEAHGGPVTDDPSPVEADLEGLKGGTKYFVRFAVSNGEETLSAEPNPEFTTLPVDPPAVVSIDNASAVSYTTASAAGKIERPANADPAFDAHCRFEYVSDQQFSANQGNSAPLYEGGGTVPCEPAGVDQTPGESSVSADLTGLAVGTAYHLRLAVSNAGGADTKEAASTFTTLDPGPATVSIEPVSAVTAGGAHFSGHITPGGTDPAFAVSWEFHCSPECPGLGGQLPADNASHEVTATATGLEPHTSYVVELIATNAAGAASAGPQSFQTSAVAPSVETLPAFAIQGGTEALLGGRVNPKNSATKYWVEYGTDSGYGNSFPASEDADAGSGHEAQILTQKVTGLTPATEYHFRLVAENAGGEETQGQDMNFETAPAGPATESCDNNTLRSENNSTELPDCRAYEQVSPADKNGYDAGTLRILPSYVAAEGGSALSFESYGAFGDSVGASTFNSYLSRRGSSGWTTQALSPPVSAESVSGGFPEFQYYTPDLKYAAVFTPANVLLAPGATPNGSNLYLRDNSTGTYRTLNLGTGPGTGPGSISFVAAASADGEHILFESSAALTADAPPGEYNLYEWSDGQLRLVTIGPDGAPIPAGGTIEAGGRTSTTTHAMSEDGSRVVFKSREGDFGQLYLYEDGQPTIEVSASRRSTPDPGGPGIVRFQGASADTSQIYFIDSEALTEDATPGRVALYRYDADTKALINLEASLGAGHELAEGVAAISEDGSYVYFHSDSKLYLWHNGTNTLVGAVPTGVTELEAFFTTYRVTGDGRYLTFQTPNRLTAYDNTDALTGEGDSEVYLYDAALQRLTCVSCNPDGLAPDGSSNFPGPPRAQRNLQRGASEDGAVFFNSSDALVPNDVNGKEDVYEWKNGEAYLISSGTSGDSSYYASASKSGDDVFFATREPLVASDRDQLLDVYDARVGGGFPRAAQSTPCEGAEACHGSARSAPGFADPATAVLSGASALSPGARRLKAALKACKQKPKKARAKCRSKARKRFTKAGRAH